MDIDEDGEGIPVVVDVKYVIGSGIYDEYEDEDEEYGDDGDVSSNGDEDDIEVSSNDDDEEYGENVEVSSSDGEEEVKYKEASTILGEEGESLDNVSCATNEFEDYNSTMNKVENSYDHKEVSSNKDEEEVDDGDDDEEPNILDESDNENTMVLNNLDYKAMYRDGDLRVPNGTTQLVDSMYGGVPRDAMVASRFLFESKGKLLTVRRTKFQPVRSRGYNLKVEAMEADVDAGSWIPLPAGASGTFFISKRYSKYVPALEEAGNKLTYHFVDEHGVGIGWKSKLFDPSEGKPTWFFPQEVAV
jgi:hypothetical protein